MGAATLVGGALTGALYDVSIPTLIITVAAIQATALVLLFATRTGDVTRTAQRVWTKIRSRGVAGK
jgi:hypothetical protein